MTLVRPRYTIGVLVDLSLIPEGVGMGLGGEKKNKISSTWRRSLRDKNVSDDKPNFTYM